MLFGAFDRRSCVFACGVVAALNCIFFAIALLAALIPSWHVVQPVSSAFANGDLVDRDYLLADSARGDHQYNDCLLLQLIINPDESLTKEAVAPRVFSPRNGDDQCRTLRGIVEGTVKRADLVGARYPNYWFGFLPLAKAMLQIFSLHLVRFVYKSAVYTTLLLLAFAIPRRSSAAPLLGSIFVTSLAFWGLPYYGQSLSHAPGDAVVVLGLSGLVFWRRVLLSHRAFVAYCTGFGAIVCYFEFLTGQLPTAAGFLFPLAYMLAAHGDEDSSANRKGWQFASLGLIAFFGGALATESIKLAIVCLVLGPNDFLAAINDLMYRATGPLPDAKYIGHAIPILTPYWKLLGNLPVLTFGNWPGAIVLVVTSALAWLLALGLAQRSASNRADTYALLCGAAIVLVWPLVLPEHTAVHGAFMVRMLVVPIATGWAALYAEISATRRKFQVA